MSDLPGQWGPTMVATEKTQKICDQVKPQVEEKTGKIYQEFKALEYRKDTVKGGDNLLIKVYVGENEYIHLSVFEEGAYQGGKVVLRDVQKSKTREDPIVPF